MSEEVVSSQKAGVSSQNGEASSQQEAAEVKPVVLYDVSARNKFVFGSGDEPDPETDFVFIFGPVTDERYVQFRNSMNVHGRQDELKENVRKAAEELWNDTVVAIENVDYPEGADWKELVESDHKVASMNNVLAVAAFTKLRGKLKLGEASPEIVITTEAYFNGEITEQQHHLVKKSEELMKRFDRINKKTLKQEKIQGLKKLKPSFRFIPQDEAFGELYDAMFISVEGFQAPASTTACDIVPLRFKTSVINEVFSSQISQKSLGK